MKKIKILPLLTVSISSLLISSGIFATEIDCSSIHFIETVKAKKLAEVEDILEACEGIDVDESVTTKEGKLLASPWDRACTNMIFEGAEFYYELAQLLLEKGNANPDIIKDNLSPLHTIITFSEYGDAQLIRRAVELLFKYNTDPDLKNGELTPLFRAVIQNSEGIVALLLEHNANTNIEANFESMDIKTNKVKWFKQLPLEYAATMNYQGISNLLHEHGAHEEL